jgi:VanZ family protein
LLTAQFLVPGDVAPGLIADVYQPVLCFAVALGVAGAFGPALLRRASARSFGPVVLKMAAALSGLFGLLELAQIGIPGRTAEITDFLANAFAGTVAIAIGIALVRSRDRQQVHSLEPQPRVLSA